jgi:septum formation protein
MYHNSDEIILASGSPRRQQYLNEMGISFIVKTASVQEHAFDHENPNSFVLRMAREKAGKISLKFPDSWVISGDTVVCIEDKILGKPIDEEDAISLLMALSGREHSVKTAFCVAHYSRGIEIAKSVTTKVHFTDFSESVARTYVAEGESLDKAGAYGIQGKGALLVKSIEGSYSNVVGLPLCELIEVLQANNIIQLDNFASW